MADEVNITVGGETVVDEETGAAEGAEETPPVEEGDLWHEALEMQRTGIELLRSSLESQKQLSSELLTENRNLREAVLTIPQQVTQEIRTALAETRSSILQALTPPVIETPLLDTSQTDASVNVDVTAPAEVPANEAPAPPARRKAVRTL